MPRLALATQLLAAAATGAGASSLPEEVRLGFGSCHTLYTALCDESRRTAPHNPLCASNAEASERLWTRLRGRSLAHWLWLGDAVYADTWELLLGMSGPPAPSNPAQPRRGHFEPGSPADLQLRFAELKHNVSAYAAFVSSLSGSPASPGVPGVLGVWDDHDYGVDNGDRLIPSRDARREAFADFVGDPMLSAREGRGGVYTQRIVQTGPGGALKLQLVLLDVRYFKDPVEQEDPSLLGAEQWEWLEREVFRPLMEAEVEDRVDLLVLGTGIQVLPRWHPGECWIQYPRDRARLLHWLTQIQSKLAYPPLIISGDIHTGEILRKSLGTRGSGPFVYEATSSGLTHTYGDLSAWVGESVVRRLSLGLPVLEMAIHYFFERFWPSLSRWMWSWDSPMVTVPQRHWAELAISANRSVTLRFLEVASGEVIVEYELEKRRSAVGVGEHSERIPEEDFYGEACPLRVGLAACVFLLDFVSPLLLLLLAALKLLCGRSVYRREIAAGFVLASAVLVGLLGPAESLHLPLLAIFAGACSLW